jgi:hypothetical protein
MVYIETVCETCKKKFIIPSWKIPQGRGRFCSKRCFYNTKIGKPWGKPIKKGQRISKKTEFKKGEHLRKNHPKWVGGRTVGKSGYIFILAPKHPRNNHGYVPEHRFVMEKHLGRYLKKEEVVHHINGIVGDNRLENLMLFKSNSEHSRYHQQLRKNSIKP